MPEPRTTEPTDPTEPAEPADPTVDGAGPPGAGLPWDTLELERRARDVLSPGAAAYYEATATYPPSRENERAWRGWRFRPRFGVDVASVSTATQLLGEPVAAPVLVAPCAYAGHAHPEGELALARGAAGADTVYVVSSTSSQPPESVARSSAGTCWLQLYVPRREDELAATLGGAEQAGFRAVVVTLDAPVAPLRHRGYIPDRVFDDPHARGQERTTMLNPSVTWATVEQIAGRTRLPVLVKGVLRADDALAAIDHGARGVVVSNHGGRHLDGVVPTALVIEEVAGAVGGRATVLVDGGIRSGRDVLRALCLGADGALVGRPHLWALAVAGDAGVTELLLRMRLELQNALALTGCTSVADADRSLLTWVEHPPLEAGPPGPAPTR